MQVVIVTPEATALDVEAEFVADAIRAMLTQAKERTTNRCRMNKPIGKPRRIEDIAELTDYD